MSKKYKSLEVRAWLNNATYANWFNRLYAIAISVFKWSGLPDTVDARFLENVLFWRGFGVFFKDEVMEEIFLPMATASDLDIYGYPIMRQAVSYNYTSRMLSPDDSVIIYDNYARNPVCHSVRMYAERLYNLDTSMDVNITAQKTPLLINCDDKERLSMENLFMKYDGNIPVIYGSKGMSANPISVISTNAPFVADKLQTLKRQLLEESLTLLGVEANTNEKAERLVTGEITSNMGATEALRLNRLNARKQAAEKINKIFGLNVDVEFNSGLTLAQIMGGVNNGGIYNHSRPDLQNPSPSGGE